MTPAEALRAGLHRIRTVGWRQGHNPNQGGPCCAVESVTCWMGWPKALDFLEAANNNRNLAVWNDAPGRTQAEVEAVYERAIALAEAEEQK